MREKAKIYQCIHYNMAVCGGFLGAYAILNRCDVLGNAQTSNLIYLTLNIIGRDAWQVMIRIGAMLLYMLATMCTVLIPKYTKWNLRVISVLVDMIAVGILALLPEEMDNIVALYPVFFAMAFQWNTFANLCEYVSSTIFSTNNVRQIHMRQKRRRYKERSFFCWCTSFLSYWSGNFLFCVEDNENERSFNRNNSYDFGIGAY